MSDNIAIETLRAINRITGLKMTGAFIVGWNDDEQGFIACNASPESVFRYVPEEVSRFIKKPGGETDE